jgi:ribosomal-protein-alanine N-acetyltransferase
MKPHPAEIAIRPMTRADVEWAKDLSDASPGAPHWSGKAYLAATDPDAKPGRIALVAEVAKIASEARSFRARMGLIVASYVSPEAELETVLVAPAARRHGVARQLFTALAAGLKLASVTEVTLEVRASNRPALALYKSLGFRESGLRPRYYADPVEDAILMRSKLG